MLKRFIFLALTVIFMTTVVQAQLNQTGMITGVVNSPDGTPMPGVTVTIKSPAIVLPEMTTVTNENGKYRFPSLPPGIYEITYQLEGMNTIVRKGIKVNVGVTTRVDIDMELQTIQENIVVEGKSPTVDRQSTTRAANLDSEFLDSIPALRNIDTYFNMTPGVTSRTAHGSTVRDNAYNLDGVNLADPTVGTQGVFFGMDIMEEISVQTGGLSAEHGSTRGAVINVVSKSGGNKFSGTASVYYRNEDLQSDNTGDTGLEISGYKYEIEPGLTLGGPLVKDKLWFFTNLSFNKRELFVPGYPYDQPEEIPSDDFRPYPYLKLTFQPNQANKFIFSYNFSDIRRHHRGASRYQVESSTWEQVTPTHVFNFHWNRSFGSNFFMNFKAGGYYSEFNLLAKTEEAYFEEYTNGLGWGSYGYSDLNKRHRLQVNVDGTVFIDDMAGSHELKFGGEFQYGWTEWELQWKGGLDAYGNTMCFIYTYGGAPFYAVSYAPFKTKEQMMNIGLFVNDTWSITNNLTLNLGLRFDSQKGIIPVQATDQQEATLFGYTYDISVPETLTAMTWNTISPRVGLIYDILSDGTTLFKASYSRYYIANVSQYFNAVNPNTFVWYYGPIDANYQYVGLWGLSVPTDEDRTQLGYKDYGLKAPYVDEVTVGIEKELWEDWSVGLRYIKKWDRNLIEDADANALDMDALMDNGDLVWTNYEPITVTDPHDGSTQTFWNQIQVLNSKEYVVNPPGAERDYDGVEFTLKKRFSKGWSIHFSYVYQNSRGLIGTDFNDSWTGAGYYNNANNHENRIGRFPYERRHQIKFQGMVKGPWGINMGWYFRWLSGQRYTREVRSDDLGVALSQDPETIYAESRGNYGYPDLVILDLKLEKAFKVGPVTLRAFVDIFNVFNSGKVTEYYTVSSNPAIPWQDIEDIQDPRIFRLGAKIEF
jgi:hypothetical protein